MRRLTLTGRDFTLRDLVDVAHRQARVSVSPAARRSMAASRRVVDRAVARGDRAYGLTTGFGRFAEVSVPRGELAKRNLGAEIHVCATRVEEKEGRWTGRVLGQPMFGGAKAMAVWWYAEKWKLNLAECSAYGDSAQDQWMLASVGRPCAVNPDSGLRQAARRQAWTIAKWAREVRPKTKLAKMVPERAR